MARWDVTTTFADALVRSRTYPRARRLANAAARGALLLDLAAARLVLDRDGHLHATNRQCGFSPADALLAAITDAAGANVDVIQLVWRSSVGMDEVITELVTRGWWERTPRQLWRLRRRYRPTHLLDVTVRDQAAASLARLLMALFASTTDTDDVEAEASSTDFGAATWLVVPVIHELVELRWWLEAAVTTHQPSG